MQAEVQAASLDALVQMSSASPSAPCCPSLSAKLVELCAVFTPRLEHVLPAIAVGLGQCCIIVPLGTVLLTVSGR
jgi:hypothetical protein